MDPLSSLRNIASPAPLNSVSPMASAPAIEGIPSQALPPREFREQVLSDIATLRGEPNLDLAYARTVQRMDGLGLTLADHESLRQAHPHDAPLRSILTQDRERAAQLGPGKPRPASEVEQSVWQRWGDALRSEFQKMGEKALKTADNLASAAKNFESMPKLAGLSPLLGSFAKGLSVFANAMRGASSGQDPKQMLADFAKAVKDLLKILEKTSLKNAAKLGGKLLPGLGEAIIAWDISQATKKAQQASQRGDTQAAAAWAVVVAMNTLAFSFRGVCDLAAGITALTVGGASPATVPAMLGCEGVVGALAGISEMVAMAVDD